MTAKPANGLFDAQSAAALFVALLAMGSVLAGCGGQSTARSLDGQLKELNQVRQPTAKFSGVVTIDGKPPQESLTKTQALFILVYDPKKPPAANAAPLKTMVNRETGNFDFTTYTNGDGVPAGSYIVLFVALKNTILGKNQGYHEPDALKNLYNDPDRNEKNPEFKLDLAAPGKNNYTFDLKLNGQETPGSPGDHAVTHFKM